MKKLIVISNRLPFVITHDQDGNPVRQNSAGGLVTALTPLIIKSNGYWIGWGGNSFTEGMQVPESNDDTSMAHDLKSSQIVPVFYTEEMYKSYYNGMCNALLWPLMHSLPRYATFRNDYWNAYIEVNKLYANATFETIKKIEDQDNILVWIHDYHLLIMPLMLKNLLDDVGLSCKIAFFLHIPFPSWDVFRLIPWSNEILIGLLGCDLIAFHTNIYAINFLECCCNILGARIDKHELIVEYGNKTSLVRALPIGIPYDWFEQMAKEAPKLLTAKEKVILGVDRLDYTKGILERIHAYERFLEKYPEYKGKVTFLQIAVPSRQDVDDYKALKDELEREVGRISGLYGTAEWTPIKYIYKTLKQNELAGYYRDSAVALITPIRDGMNLVAKEYVACQISDPGVLIISPFTGAGETMTEAVRVNPLEENMVADAIKEALDMNYFTRKLRMNALQNRERMFNLDTWIDSFFEACDLLDTTQFTKMHSITTSDFDNWLSSFAKGYKLTVIVDYDGTLVPIQTHPDLAVLSDDMVELLEKLIACPNFDLCVLSGRALADVKKKLPIKNIHLAGSHGMEILLAGMEEEECLEQAAVFRNKVSDLADELRRLVCTYGGWVEEKVYHVTFHWRDTSSSQRESVIQKAKEIIQNYGFQAQQAVCAIEARPPIGWDKGRGVFHILEKLHGVTWADNVRAVFLGDDETDEDAIRALSGLGKTFRIGKPNVKTAATHRLPNPTAVKVFLEWALEYMEKRISEDDVGLNQRRNQGIVKKRTKSSI